MKINNKYLVLLIALISFGSVFSQQVKGVVTSDGSPLAYANVYIKGTQNGTSTDENGVFEINNISNGEHIIVASYTGFSTESKKINVKENSLTVNFILHENSSLEEVVITGTLKPVSRMETPVPVEVYKPAFFKKNPTANVFEALQNVNGVRPQLNCNICNTGDIHINGLEGPYTMVLIDGMPIVSGLSTVYGLSGIPNSLIERMEIIKGPASSLYGSEAVGGLINIITKTPQYAPKLTVDTFVSSWGEFNLDVGYRALLGKKTSFLFGANYFNFNQTIDNNNDNFTDLTLQNRISLFQKWDFKRKDNRLFSLASRYFYEDRWGGELQWTPEYRGGDEIYGESIYTSRWEFLGKYQLPFKENVLFTFSYTDHNQNSVYGDVPYLADQRIGFGQLTWDKKINKHDLLFGAALRYNFYDDNTAATAEMDKNNPDEVTIPSIFIQDEVKFNKKHTLLLGMRYDYDKRHGNIFTPRMAYKWSLSENDILRLNAGTGFRVVNLFTEDHAALTGARDVVIEEELKPEKSYNVNINYLKKIYTQNNSFIGLDMSAWYTYFTNMILPDYDTNPNEIIYDNLDGYAVSTGVSANVDMVFYNGIKINLGGTFMNVSQTENGITTRQILTEQFSGTWGISYKIVPWNLNIDYTGNIYGPMRLPLLGELDPRKEYSPVWSIQNIQFTYDGFKNFEIYGGIKNLLNWTPNKGNPFIIARANDPFDKNVIFDAQGNAQATPNNPYALTFDPSYVYGPNQGIRGFVGVRYQLD
ncbi:outer membrane receptor for ferrienterochelin and colicins [Galbibacter orientalis DSM 19592]|uniref:Outer membrane receptor for ferrienterochelin and colicins n=1 Tax=Galbibacter orientalis DSM 19592 TaxID=926559 RepID=I3C396_9FLAO|nr:TonB-dependent receptor [Galbibacter orientalis]EIJ38089.1 outer membrane receptor for ferrienterochelin and colicins [Galbibacter orientalis DSM 19592]